MKHVPHFLTPLGKEDFFSPNFPLEIFKAFKPRLPILADSYRSLATKISSLPKGGYFCFHVGTKKVKAVCVCVYIYLFFFFLVVFGFVI